MLREAARSALVLVPLVTGLGIVATLLGRLGSFAWLFGLFSHFPIQLGLALSLCAIAATLLGRRRLGAVALAFALLNAAIALPQLLYWPTAEAGAGGAIRLIHANVNHTNESYEAAREFFRTANPDILVVQEVDREWRAQLEPLSDELPHSYHAFTRGRYGITILSRYPIRGEMVQYVRRNGTIVAEIDVEGRQLLLVAAHPYSPVSPRRTRLRDRELDAIADLVRTRGGAAVLIGDLNTTPWGPAFRSLVSRSGLRDSSRGVGYQWSWPAPYWPLAIPIDHCLVSEDIKVLDRRIGPSIGSDHKPLVVDISLP